MKEKGLAIDLVVLNDAEIVFALRGLKGVVASNARSRRPNADSSK